MSEVLGCSCLKHEKAAVTSWAFLVNIFDFKYVSLCYVIIVCMCYVFSCCARVMFLLLACVMCRFFVCVMCRLLSALCAGFSLCYVQFAVTNLVASLRACLASLAWLASLAAGASRPQDPLRTEKSHAVTAALDTDFCSSLMSILYPSIQIFRTGVEG